MLFDTHAHLDDPAFDADRPDVLARARSAGVTGIVTVGTDVESSRRAAEIAAAHDGVWAAVGIHPHESDRLSSDAAFEALKELAARPRVVAIGETGLDAVKRFSGLENQKLNFRRHLRLARERGLPVVIHCREAHTDVRAIVREEMDLPVRGVIHCFSGGVRDVEDYLALGFTLSIAGPITFKNASGLRAAARAIPADRLLVETDCPYLTPEPHRGKRNEPAFVRHTAQALADQCGISLDALCGATTKTAQLLFRI
ncbi:MAG: TatD family hydrolase [Planctomycetes bacterium]|nr:TatD family hydrolase [Planctomycetota bacterium]